MSIPVDRLHNFLHDIVKQNDVLIYRFLPHGSRKLENLEPLDERYLSWFERMTTPAMIFHDQEILYYHFYNKKEFEFFADRFFHPSDNPKKLLASMHLRACIDAPLGVYDQVLLCHSEKNSSQLELYQQNGFVGVYYWSHALIARDWYRFANLDSKLIPNFDNITHDFLIYNRAWSGSREYRLTLAEILANNNLISCCKMSFSKNNNELFYTQHVFSNLELAITRSDLHQLYPANTHDSNASADYNNKDYLTCAIEVVLETLFDDLRHHLTEKALRPIACGRPFILAATPGSLQYLKQYGFKTFDGLINETYDTIVNPRERLEAIVQEMKRINNLDTDTKRLLWTKLYKIADYNKKLFFSAAWQDSIIKEFKENFDIGLKQLTATGKYQQELEHMALTDLALASFRAKDHPGGHPTVQDREAIRRWIQEKNSIS